MKPQLRSVLLMLLVTTAAGSTIAQEAAFATGVDGPITTLDRSAGVSVVDGIPYAIGPDYRARFADAGMEFVPALGRAASTSVTIRLRLESIGRASGLESGTAAAPGIEATEREVRYRHGDVVEIYEARPEGLALAFRLPRLPPGSGDLIVRSRLASNAPLSHRSSDELRFEHPGVGGVRIGGVIGIDAGGATAPGELRFDGRMLEMRLPAEFVDHAALPLVLDPLIGSVIAFGSANDRRPDVAYDYTKNRYLVVWERASSLNDVDLIGQEIASNGILVGGPIALQIDSATNLHPSVANVNRRNRFVVTWARGGDIVARSVDADTRSVSPLVVVAGGSDVEDTPDIGGESELGSNHDAIAAWTNITRNQIRAAELTVLPDGSLVTGTPVTVASGFIDRWPSISKSGGTTGRYLVVWERGTGARSVIGAVVDRDLRLLDRQVVVANHNRDERRPDVDGDGLQWLVAWESSTAPAGSADVVCRRVAIDPVTNVATRRGTETFLESDPEDEHGVAVSWTGGSYLVAYAQQLTGQNDGVFVRSIDPFPCVDCEGRFNLQIDFARDAEFLAIASRMSGHRSPLDDAIVLWQSTDPTTGDGDVKGWRFHTQDGVFHVLGAGCGTGGTAYATCARRGYADFALQLVGARPSVPASVALGTDANPMPIVCGACVLIPDLSLGSVGAPTNVLGEARYPAPIPNVPSVVGFVIVFQWISYVPSGSGACLSTFDLSNAAAIRIQ